VKASSILPLASLLGLLVPACRAGSDCTLLACASGVDVALHTFAVTHAGDLPLTLSVCVGSACDAFQVSSSLSGAVCTSSANNVLCTIDGLGTVVLTELPIPDGTADGTSLPVHVVASNKQGTVIADATQPVTIALSQPNGPGCDPTCHGGQVTLSL
jgi:hypothetical protein